MSSSIAFITPFEDHGELHVIARRTYTFGVSGRCALADEQSSLTLEPEYGPEDAHGAAALISDSDLWCATKSGTDVVVQGSAHCAHAVPRTTAAVGVVTSDGMAHAERSARRVVVTGERTVETVRGKLSFSEPERFVSMPITYERAYGGRDVRADRAHPDEVGDAIASALGIQCSPHTYVRNPIGRAFVVHPERDALEGLALPNIEDPADLLTPERLAIGDRARWPSAPRPASFDWCDLAWFPRLAALGFCPPHDMAAGDIWEVRCGYLPEAAVSSGGTPFREPRPSLASHGASPPLVLPRAVELEGLLLEGLHRAMPRLCIALPSERPQLIARVREPIELSPRLATVIVQPDLDRLTTVWCGSVEVAITDAYSQSEPPHAVRWRTT
jgi:hypothetical protein